MGKKILPVILSGGSGSRLWPLSREHYPKQFLPLLGQLSLLEATLGRLAGLPGVDEALVICNDDHRFLVAEQLLRTGVRGQVVLEPVGRNTAPAVAVAALLARAAGDDPLLLVLPADHVIRADVAFADAVARAAAQAEAGDLVTFGIQPQGPETGYGYIRIGASVGEHGLHRVQRFVEKPDRSTAEAYLAQGGFFWNSGMFLFRASVYLHELAQHAPDMLRACEAAVSGAVRDLDFLRLEPDAFAACPADSVDYAVMERTARAAVLPVDLGWSDLGAWSSLWEVAERDAQGNVLSGDVQVLGAHGCYARAEGRLLALVGVDDLVVVETPDAVLVAHKDRVQDVKGVVDALRSKGRDEVRHHRRVYRPWGSYEGIDAADRFQVKRITVHPGAALSLQMHHHRAEHWVVVRGTAKVTRGDEVLLLSENQSTYIPLGTTHRLENPGRIPLELIEVQSGAYLGEDDIVRYDDRYGREGHA